MVNAADAARRLSNLPLRQMCNAAVGGTVAIG